MVKACKQPAETIDATGEFGEEGVEGIEGSTPGPAGEDSHKKCAVCRETGHYARDCTKERVDRFACRNCRQRGHTAADCTEPKSAENVECRRCGQSKFFSQTLRWFVLTSLGGHFSKDCPDAPPPRTCRNCGQEGHMSKECTEPPNPANTTCRNCDKVGHFSRDCPEPRDYSRVTCRTCGESKYINLC